MIGSRGECILLEKASKTLKLNNINIINDYTGLRSGSNDYLPMLGSLVDAEATLENIPIFGMVKGSIQTNISIIRM
jgi:hypothetical protein